MSSRGNEGAQPKKSESLAEEVVELMLPGSLMRYNAAQSHGEYDYDLVLPSGEPAIMEVTEITLPVWRAMSKELARTPTIPRVLCQKNWRVAPEFGANVTRIRKHVDRYLAAVEEEGIERFSRSRPASPVLAVESERTFASLWVPSCTWRHLESAWACRRVEASSANAS